MSSGAGYCSLLDFSNPCSTNKETLSLTGALLHHFSQCPSFVSQQVTVQWSCKLLNLACLYWCTLPHYWSLSFSKSIYQQIHKQIHFSSLEIINCISEKFKHWNVKNKSTPAIYLKHVFQNHLLSAPLALVSSKDLVMICKRNNSRVIACPKWKTKQDKK